MNSQNLFLKLNHFFLPLIDQYEIDEDNVKFEKRAKFEESNKPIAEKLITIIKKDKV